jgi:hypothetical protein
MKIGRALSISTLVPPFLNHWRKEFQWEEGEGYANLHHDLGSEVEGFGHGPNLVVLRENSTLMGKKIYI